MSSRVLHYHALGIIPVLALLLGAAAIIGCRSDQPVGVDDGNVRLSLRAQVVGGSGRAVEIRVFYRRAGDAVQLLDAPRRAALGTGATIPPLVIRIGACLRDAARDGAADSGCRVAVELRLLDDLGAVIDSQVAGPVDSRPGETVRFPDVVLGRLALTIRGAGSGSGLVASAPGGIACTITAGAAGDTGCSGGYSSGTRVALTATAAPGHSFTGWSGEGCGGSESCTVTMSRAATVMATFAAPVITYPLAIQAGGNGSGDVASQSGLAPAIACSVGNGSAGAQGCSAAYPSGTQVTLTAAARAGSSFTGWGGPCEGGGSCTVTMSQVRAVRADFVLDRHALAIQVLGTGGGTVTSSPAGIDCVVTQGAAGSTGCNAVFNNDVRVTLTAVPSAGNAFAGWSGEGCSGNASCEVTMSQSRTVTASFSPVIFTLAVAPVASNTGSGRIIGGGIDCTMSASTTSGPTCNISLTSGTQATLTASPSANSAFGGWSGEGCGGAGTCTVSMNQARTVTATFTLNQYVLTVQGGGAGSGTVTSSPSGITCSVTTGTAGSAGCSGRFDSGTQVTLVATPQSGSTFDGWSGEGCSGSGTCRVTTDRARAVTATFKTIPYSLTIAGGGSGRGTVTSSPAGISCSITSGTAGDTGCGAVFNSGAQVTLTAAAAAGNLFGGWSGEGCGGTGACVVSMTQARTVTATFRPLSYTVTAQGGGSGSGLVTSTPGGIACTISAGVAGSTGCSAGYTAGTAVTLTAAPRSGNVFVEWVGEGCSGKGTCQLSMSQARTVTARFDTTFTLSVAIQRVYNANGRITSEVGGIDCTLTDNGAPRGTCSTTVAKGTVVRLTASLTAGYFSGWGGAAPATCTSTRTPPTSCDVTVDRALTVTAGFYVIGEELELSALRHTIPAASAAADARPRTTGMAGGTS